MGSAGRPFGPPGAASLAASLNICNFYHLFLFPSLRVRWRGAKWLLQVIGSVSERSRGGWLQGGAGRLWWLPVSHFLLCTSSTTSSFEPPPPPPPATLCRRDSHY